MSLFSRERRKVLRGTEVECNSSELIGSDIQATRTPSLLRCKYFSEADSLIAFGTVFSLIGEELKSSVTIIGIGPVVFVDKSSVSIATIFGGCRGGLCAACRVLFGRIVRILFTSELMGSI